MNKDWTGNSQATHVVNQRNDVLYENDYYATDPRAVEILLENEVFDQRIWECACGEGHISKVLENHNYHVYSTDLINRNYGVSGVDFLKQDIINSYNGDIVTNPPYKYAKEFVEKAIEIISNGHKVAMFLKLTFLEGQGRRELFKKYPPKTVYVSSARLQCAKNGLFSDSKNSDVAYCWIIWEKGYSGFTQLKWIN